MAKHRLTDYIALDRRWALARGDQLAEQSEGSALFADVSGFTPLTEALVKSLGERRGTETLPHYLNMVYDALINDVNRFYGSVIGFAGDAITCWFDRDDGYRALVCALSMQQSMEQFQDMEVAPGMVVSLAMKVAIAHGPVRRFAVGSPEVQLIDVLAGETLTRMARAEHHAERGDIVLDAHTATRLAERIHVLEWRKATDIPEIPTSNPHLTNNDITNNDVTNQEVQKNGVTDGVTKDGVTKDGVTRDEVSANIAATERLAIPDASTEPLTEPSTDASNKPPTSNLTDTGTGTDTFAVIDKVAMGLTVYAHAPESPVESDINPRLPEDDYQAVRNWILPPVYDRLKAGQGEFLTELRPTTALFLRFGGLDYDDDPEAGTSLNRFIRWVQGILHDYDGTLIQLTVGDKGSYLYASFGAPTAHEDDTRRALQVALQLRQPPAELGIVDVSIGLAQGTMRTGAYGGSTRRTYGVLGDDVNLAARLMGKAAPGQVLVSERVYQLEASHFQWQDLPRMKVKGKSEPIAVYALVDVTRNQGYIPSSSKLPLIGRQHELEQLTACLARVQQGQGQFALVQGEAGMGKSRLIAAVLEQARNTDGLCRIHTGECQSYGRNSAYLVWQNIWRDLLELDSSASAQTQISHLQQTISDLSEELLPRLPLLAPLLALPISDNALTASLEPQVRKAATEALLSDLLQALAKRIANTSDTGNPQNPKPQNSNPQNFKQGHFIVLVLEDTQWIDALSADVLSVLVRAVRNLPVLLIAAERPSSEGSSVSSSVSQLAADLQNAPEGATAVLEVELAELSKADMERLIYSKLRSFDDADAQTNPTGTNHAPTSTDTADITSTDTASTDTASTDTASTDTAVNLIETTLPEATLQRLTERAQGNPFYIEELLNVARAKGLDLHDPGVWATLELPNSLHSLILTRIDQLDERLQITLKVASVIGRSLYAHWLTGYFPELGAPTSVRERLESLCALLLLSKESHLRNVAPDTASDDMFAYVFRQVITRDVAYESLAYQKRAELHERFAHYLEQQTQQDTSTSPNTPDVDAYLDLLAYHFDQSDNASKARDYLSRAGRAAQARYDNQTAIGYYQKVLAYLEREQQQLKNQDNRIENARQRVDILLDLGRVLQLVGEWDLAQTYFEEALHCGQNDCQQASAEAKSAMALGNLLLKRNQYDDAIHWLEHAKQLWEAQVSSPETRSSISHIFSELGNIAWRQGDHDHARTLLNAGLDIARAQDDKLNMSHALRILGGIAYVENDYDNARSQFEDALALMRELDNQSEMIKYQSNLGAIAIGLHDYDEAIKRYEESLQLAEAIGAKEQIAGILVNVGVAHSERQDYPKAKALYERALKLYHDMGNPSGAADALLSLGVIANAADNLDEAEQLYRESLRLSSNHKDRVVILTFNLAIVLEKRADLTSSQRYFAKSVQVAQQIGDTLGVAYGIAGIARTRLQLAAHLDTPPADIASADIPTESGHSHKTATFHDPDAETSLILCAATSAILKQHGLALNQDEHDKLQALITDLRQHFAERAETLWQRGIQLSTDQAVTLALSFYDGNQGSDQGSNQGSDSDNHHSGNENAKDTNPISNSANSEDKDTPSADAAPDHTQQIGG